jgi:hypothetical protein
MDRISICKSFVVALVAGAIIPAFAAAAKLPSEQHQGEVGFVTGGIGEAEARAFEQGMHDYPLAVELLEHAGRKDAFTADTMVQIADRHGHTVLATQAQGPFLLVDLPPGRYSVEATLNHHTLTKSAVMVERGTLARATFEFPAHTD